MALFVSLLQYGLPPPGVRLRFALLDEGDLLGGAPYDELVSIGEEAYIQRYARSLADNDEDTARIGSKVPEGALFDSSCKALPGYVVAILALAQVYVNVYLRDTLHWAPSGASGASDSS